MPAKQHRITRGDDYRRIVRNGFRVGGAASIAHAVLHVGEDAEEREPARFGFIISKAVGGAVTRNLVRRRMKSIVERRLAAGFTGADVVFRALPASAGTTYTELASEMDRQLDRVSERQAGSHR